MIRLLARPLLASWFVYQGVQQLRAPAAQVDGATQIVGNGLAELGLDVPDEVITQAQAGLQVAAGTGLALSRTPKSAAVLLAALATLRLAGTRPFWRQDSPAERHRAADQYLVQLSLLGALLLATTGSNKKRKRKPTKASQPSLRWRR